MVSNAKTRTYSVEEIEHTKETILEGCEADVHQYSERLSRAFTPQEWEQIIGLLEPIRHLGPTTKDFFLVALLRTAKGFSRGVSDGGWLRWYDWPDKSNLIRQAFVDRVTSMVGDIVVPKAMKTEPNVEAMLGDARWLPFQTSSIDGVITSPPYANRHDYSRIFHIELLLLGLSEPTITDLRHHSVRSHVEASTPPIRDQRVAEYFKPNLLKRVLKDLPETADRRVKRLLGGYFEDMYLSLSEVARVLKPGCHAAYVIGNVRHAGIMVPADQLIVEIGSQVGLMFDQAWVIRFRGNSAQQMGTYGREPARETVVLFSKGTQS